jgi:hypothetical protein
MKNLSPPGGERKVPSIATNIMIDCPARADEAVSRGVSHGGDGLIF